MIYYLKSLIHYRTSLIRKSSWIRAKHDCPHPRSFEYASNIIDFIDDNENYHGLRAYEGQNEADGFLMVGFFPQFGVICDENYTCKCGIPYPGIIKNIREASFKLTFDGQKNPYGYVIIHETTGKQVVYKLENKSHHSGFVLHTIVSP